MITELFDLTRDAHDYNINFRANGRGYKLVRYAPFNNNLHLYFGSTYLIHGWYRMQNWRILTTTQGEQ